MRDRASLLPLEASGLGYAAGGRAILEDVSFRLERGRRLVLLGPNGAGKSVLLRLCHGLLPPSAGTIRWASEPGGPGRRHAMVFQKPVMLRRSALGNVTHALLAAGERGILARRRAAGEALARFGLASAAASPARLLSGGEQQRLAIARAWALRPEVMFLDEPTASLDPTATRQIETLLAGLHTEGVTLAMATHDLGQARRFADDVLFLVRGRLVEAGSAEAFFTAPRTAEARAFLAGDLLW
jgi:tungstate transport system ATP-binding protein